MRRLVRTQPRRGAYLALLVAATVSLGAASRAGASDSTGFAAQMRAAQRHAATSIRAMELALPAGRYPVYTEGASWHLSHRANGWANGYFPGELWLEYQRTTQEWWRSHALSREAAIGALDVSPSMMDLGVLFYPSFARGYRLTGDQALRAVALRAAASLAARYDPVVDAIRSRSTAKGFFVNVDSLLDNRLLWWGVSEGGPERWGTIARRHALKVARDFVRVDGSTCHVVLFDEATGEVIDRMRGQGYSADSMWSRGQAWAIHGFADAFRHTGEPAFLNTARRVADRYLAELPVDWIPYWDFRAPRIPDEPRDTSAAAVAASGLIDLASLEPNEVRAQRYAVAARTTLSVLASDAYSHSGVVPAVRSHGTANYWAHRIDLGLVYGDYFYLEALLRLRLLPPQDSPISVAGWWASAGTPSLAVDGDPGTSWTTTGHQWLDLDLGGVHDVAAVRVALHDGTTRAATLRILVSKDRVGWTPVVQSMSSGETSGLETYDFSPRGARWVRLECFGTTLGAANLVNEVQVYGTDSRIVTETADPGPSEGSDT
jgi:unsaturated chondroitin disaccharide hydrolase